MEEGVETKASAARSSLEAGRASLSPELRMLRQSTSVPQQSWVGMAFGGPTLPAEGAIRPVGHPIWRCTTAPDAEQEGSAEEGRSLVLLMPTEVWWWPTEDQVKFGQKQRAELTGSACVHQASHSWKYPLCLGWCFWSAVEMQARSKESEKWNKSYRIAEWLKLEGTSGVTQSNPLLQTGPVWPGPVHSGSEHLQGWRSYSLSGHLFQCSLPGWKSVARAYSDFQVLQLVSALLLLPLPVTSQKIPALFSFCPPIRPQKTTPSFSFSLLWKLNKPSSLGISLCSSLPHAGGHCWTCQLHLCCHSPVCRQLPSPRGHAPDVPSQCCPGGIRITFSANPLGTPLAPSQSCCTLIIHLKFLVAFHDEQGSNVLFFNKIPTWLLLSFVYVFLAAYLLFVWDYILKMRMMHFKRHRCQLQ